MNLPNLLSLSRLALAVLFAFVSTSRMQVAVIALAGLTDMSDGWIARRFGQRSRLGEMLDPITDKLFVLTVVVVMLWRGQLQWLHVLILLTRDLFNTIAFIWLRARHSPLRFKSRFSGKVVTMLQMATLLSALIWPAAFRSMLGLTFGASLFAIFDYARAGLASLRQAPGPR